jgi:hypothetical protein
MEPEPGLEVHGQAYGKATHPKQKTREKNKEQSQKWSRYQFSIANKKA